MPGCFRRTRVKNKERIPFSERTTWAESFKQNEEGYYMRQRIVDCHMHISSGRPQRLAELADRHGFDKFNVLSFPCVAGEANNLEALLAKKLFPGRAYAFGGLIHTGARDAESYARQVCAMIDAGLDGLKFLETKPDKMRALGTPLDGPQFEGVFSIAEEERWPILWHVGDPATFWSKETAPQFAVKYGWVYDDPSFPTLTDLYVQAENVLRRHPNLQVCFPHFFFTSDDMPHARRVLETWPGVRFDFTPGVEMFGNFAIMPEAWREFFIQYSKRLLFGTDFTDDANFEVEDQENMLRLLHGTLASEEKFTALEIDCQGVHLPQKVLDDIYAANFERFADPAPRALNAEGVIKVYELAVAAVKASGGDSVMLERCERLVNEIVAA